MRARTKSFEFSSVTPPPQSNPELELTAKAMLIGKMCISRSKRLRRNQRAWDREDRRPDRFRL